MREPNHMLYRSFVMNRHCSTQAHLSSSSVHMILPPPRRALLLHPLCPFPPSHCNWLTFCIVSSAISSRTLRSSCPKPNAPLQSNHRRRALCSVQGGALGFVQIHTLPLCCLEALLRENQLFSDGLVPGRSVAKRDSVHHADRG